MVVLTLAAGSQTVHIPPLGTPNEVVGGTKCHKKSTPIHAQVAMASNFRRFGLRARVLEHLHMDGELR